MGEVNGVGFGGSGECYSVPELHIASVTSPVFSVTLASLFYEGSSKTPRTQVMMLSGSRAHPA